jgi:WD40 repeat protein
MNGVKVDKSTQMELKELWTQANSQGALTNVNFSPDGKRIVSQYQRGVDLLDVHTGKLLQSKLIGTDGGTAVFFDNGKKIAIGGGRDRTLSILEANTLEVLAKNEVPGGDVYSVSPLTDGKRLAVTAGGLWLFDSTARPLVELSRLRSSREPHNPFFRSCVAHPKNNTILAGSGYVLQVFDVDTGKLKTEKKSNASSDWFTPEQIVCSGNGAFIATALDNSCSKNLHVLYPNSLEIVNKKYFSDGPVSMAFSSDATFLAICNTKRDNRNEEYGPKTSTLYLTDPGTNDILAQMTLGKRHAQSIVISPDGKYLAAGVGCAVQLLEIVKKRDNHE